MYPLKAIPFLQCTIKRKIKQAETEFGHSVSEESRRFKKHMLSVYKVYGLEENFVFPNIASDSSDSCLVI